MGRSHKQQKMAGKKMFPVPPEKDPAANAISRPAPETKGTCSDTPPITLNVLHTQIPKQKKAIFQCKK
jgi:hypothetical protein